MTVSTRKGMLDLTPNAITVLERRYLVKDDHGAPVEGPEDLFWRGAPPRPPPPAPAGAAAGLGGGPGAGLSLPGGAPAWGARPTPALKPCRPPRPPSAAPGRPG